MSETVVGDSSSLTSDEKAFVDRYDWRNAWETAKYLSEPNEGWAYSIGVIGKVEGTPAVKATADWVVAKLKSYGWDSAHLETYATTTWDFRGNVFRISYLKNGTLQTEELRSINYGYTLGTYGTVNGETYDLSNTQDGGISYPLVYGGQGTSADLDAAGALMDKMVLVLRNDAVTGWPNAPLYEAFHRGAKAVVFYGYYGENQDPNSLRGDTLNLFDAPIPVFEITTDEAHQIIDLLNAKTAVTAYGRARINIQTEAVGQSWNVIAVLPGAKYPDQYVALNDQMDTWFYGPSNGNSGLGTLLEIARLLGEDKARGILPDRSILILLNGGEEQGGTAGTWFNWLGGSWAFLTVQHPELRGKIVAELNLENIGFKSNTGVSSSDVSWDLQGFYNNSIRDLGFANNITTTAEISPFSDEWSFGAIAGSSWVDQAGEPGYDFVYHTYNDTMALQNPAQYQMFGRLDALLVYRLARSPFLPIDIGPTVEWMNSSLSWDRVTLPDSNMTSGYDSAAQAISKLASAWQTVKAELDSLRAKYITAEDSQTSGTIDAQVQLINEKILEARSAVNHYMFGMTGSMPGWWFSFRPDQYAYDGAELATAISSLGSGNLTATAAALEGLNGMDWGHVMGKWTWDTLQARFAFQQGWGSEYEQQQQYVNIHATYLNLITGNSTGAMTSLERAYQQLLGWERHDLDLVTRNLNAASDSLLSMAVQSELATAAQNLNTLKQQLDQITLIAYATSALSAIFLVTTAALFCRRGRSTHFAES